MFKDLKKINYTPYLLVAGGFVTILLFMNSLRVVSDLSSTDKTSETLIEMPNIPNASTSQSPATTTEEVTELDQNTKALNARSEILAKADGVYSQILGTTKTIDEQRALSWLLFAKKEAHKTQQTSREFLTSKFLGQIEQLRDLTNNQWLTTTSDKAKDFYWITGEARAILIALTQTPTGSGADEKIFAGELFDSLNQSYSALINENNLVRFESQQVLKRNLVGPAKTSKTSDKTNLEHPDQGNAKAIEEGSDIDFHEDSFKDESETKEEVKPNN